MGTPPVSQKTRVMVRLRGMQPRSDFTPTGGMTSPSSLQRKPPSGVQRLHDPSDFALYSMPGNLVAICCATLTSDNALDLLGLPHSDRLLSQKAPRAQLHRRRIRRWTALLADMAVTPAIVLAKLQGLNISAEVIDHPAVLTVEVVRKH